jgi:hypothetical protein
MFDGNNKYDKLIKPWYERTMGVFIAGGAIGGFVFNVTEIELFLLGRILSALVGAFGSLVLHSLLFLPIMIITSGIDAASQEKNPVRQGFSFVFFIIVLAIFFDAALLGGMFLFNPLISLIFNGDLNNTFYSCDNWVSMDEGAYCAD